MSMGGKWQSAIYDEFRGSNEKNVEFQAFMRMLDSAGYQTGTRCNNLNIHKAGDPNSDEGK